MCYEMQCIQVFDGDAGDGGDFLRIQKTDVDVVIKVDITEAKYYKCIQCVRE